MAADAKKWLMGCGIGCASVILIAVVSVIVISSLVRQEFQGVERAVESHRELSDRYGDVEDYVPPAGGAIPAERMEIFLSVRESLADQGAKLEAALVGVEDWLPEGDEHSFRSAIRILTHLGGLVSPIGEYVKQRNDALMARGMSLGEYLYIYTIAYYSWLGNSPADGPAAPRDAGRGREALFGEDSAFGPRALRRQYRRFTLAFLRRLEDRPGPDSGGEWSSSLAREISRLEDDSSAVAWDSGLPRRIEESLAPYRERLQRSYRPSVNCFELPVRNGEFRYRGR